MALPLILDCAGNENITIEDAEQPEEGVGVGEGVKGRKRERGGKTDEGTNGRSNLFPIRFHYGGFTFSSSSESFSSSFVLKVLPTIKAC